jgi:hypothetical protein
MLRVSDTRRVYGPHEKSPNFSSHDADRISRESRTLCDSLDEQRQSEPTASPLTFDANAAANRLLGACGPGVRGILLLVSSANLDPVRSNCADRGRDDFRSPDWAHPEVEFVTGDGPSPEG